MGALLNTTNIIIRECFHLQSLFKILNKLTHEYIFLQQQKLVVTSIPLVGLPPPFSVDEVFAPKLLPVLASKASAVISGGSPITHAGKSNKAML